MDVNNNQANLPPDISLNLDYPSSNRQLSHISVLENLQPHHQSEFMLLQIYDVENVSPQMCRIVFSNAIRCFSALISFGHDEPLEENFFLNIDFSFAYIAFEDMVRRVNVAQNRVRESYDLLVGHYVEVKFVRKNFNSQWCLDGSHLAPSLQLPSYLLVSELKPVSELHLRPAILGHPIRYNLHTSWLHYAYRCLEQTFSWDNLQSVGVTVLARCSKQPGDTDLAVWELFDGRNTRFAMCHSKLHALTPISNSFQLFHLTLANPQMSIDDEGEVRVTMSLTTLPNEYARGVQVNNFCIDLYLDTKLIYDCNVQCFREYDKEDLLPIIIAKAQLCIEIDAVKPEEIVQQPTSAHQTETMRLNDLPEDALRRETMRLNDLPEDALRRILQYRNITTKDAVKMHRTCKFFKSIVTVGRLIDNLLTSTLDHYIFGANFCLRTKSSMYDSLRRARWPMIDNITMLTDPNPCTCSSTGMLKFKDDDDDKIEQLQFRPEYVYCNLSVQSVNAICPPSQFQQLHFYFTTLSAKYHCDPKSSCSIEKLGWIKSSTFDVYDFGMSLAPHYSKAIGAVVNHYPLSFGMLGVLENLVNKQMRFFKECITENSNLLGSFSRTLQGNFAVNNDHSATNEGFAVTLALTDAFAKHVFHYDAPDFDGTIFARRTCYFASTTFLCNDFEESNASFVMRDSDFDDCVQPEDMIDEDWSDLTDSSVVFMHDGCRTIPIIFNEAQLHLLAHAFGEYASSNNISVNKIEEMGINLIIDVVLKSPFTIAMRQRSSDGDYVQCFTQFIADAVKVREVVTGHSKCFAACRGKNIKMILTNSHYPDSLQCTDVDNIMD